METIKYTNKEDITVAIVGSGGEGIVSAGEILMRAASHNGLYGMMIKSYGPQIRGGEILAQIRLKKSPVLSQGDVLDALVVLNWEHYFRLSEEIHLDEKSVVLHDNKNLLPENLPFSKNVISLGVPFTEVAKKITGTPLYKNMVVLGFLIGWFGLPPESFEREIQQRYTRKSEKVATGNLKAFNIGIELAETNEAKTPFDWSNDNKEPKMILNGNEAISLGALFAGIQFYSGYPITPASDIMEWMAKELPKFEGVFIQTEDEIAAITMAIGASFAGAKAMTATSGPGLSLMTEGIGLATMAEIPVVIVDVQRSGPSTGIATKPTQADLFHALFGGHGNLPRVVLAPTNNTDAIYIIVHAFYLAEKYQLPVLVLTDQFLGQRLEVIQQVDFNMLRPRIISRTIPCKEELHNYIRYKMSVTGVSPMSRPGIENGIYTAYGTEHDEMSRPTSSFDNHKRMTYKRSKKIQTIQQQEADLLWRYGDTNTDIGIIAWGSTKGVVEEAVSSIRDNGNNITVMIPRQLAPLPKKELQTFVNQLKELLIFESSDGQFYAYLKSQIKLPDITRVYKHTCGAPFTVHEITNAIKENKPKWMTTPYKITKAI